MRTLVEFKFRSVALSLLALVLACSEAPAQFADLEGQVVFTGDIPELPLLVTQGADDIRDAEICASEDVSDQRLLIDRESTGVGNVFVWVREPSQVNPELAEIPTEPLEIEVKNCVFQPHASILRCHQTVLTTTRDGAIHYPMWSTVENGPFSRAIAPEIEDRDGRRVLFEDSFPKREKAPSPIDCAYHVHMRAYCLILDHPYAAVTDVQGRFKIPGLPVGTNVLTIWHESGGYIHKALEVTVAEEGTILDPIKVQATLEEGEFRKLVPAE
jgi:hypothetical protein